MKLAEFLPYLQGVKATPKGNVACCPAHDDRHPSLVVKETDDRLLIHCWAGCRTTDVLAAMGLDFPDLFHNHGKIKKTTLGRTGPRQPERVPSFYWDWRSQCAELERAIQGKRMHAQAMLTATHGLDINGFLTASEFDEVMGYVGRGYSWLDRCERLDDTLYLLQGTLHEEERQAPKSRGRKAVAG